MDRTSLISVLNNLSCIRISGHLYPSELTDTLSITLIYAIINIQEKMPVVTGLRQITKPFDF